MRARSIITAFLGLVAASPAWADGPPTGAALKAFTKEYGCSANTTVFRFVMEEHPDAQTYTTWDVTGCGAPFAYTWVALGGRGAGFDDKSLRMKAPFEMSCDPGQVTYTYLDKYTRGASGCGARISYVLLSKGNWVANTTSTTPAPPAPPPAAPAPPAPAP